MTTAINLNQIKASLKAKSPEFWPLLKAAALITQDFAEQLALANLLTHAKKSQLGGNPTKDSHRVAFLGGYTFDPLSRLFELYALTHDCNVDVFKGEFDSYTVEILGPNAALAAFKPTVCVLMPSERRGHYVGALTDANVAVQEQVTRFCDDHLSLCKTLNNNYGADVVLANYRLLFEADPGPARSKTLASTWSFRKLINMQLGRDAERSTHIWDLEYLGARFGLEASHDTKGWLESRQLGSIDFQMFAAQELASMVARLRRPMKKVLALDLDNTLWGGVIGDDGLEGIQLGDTSPVGEAYKEFQRYIKSLTERGVLLAVCSKNEEAAAKLPFEKHPDMVLTLDDIICFKANWQPKADNLKAIADELNLGVDSLVFVDDNPAEIDIVRQYLPAVSTIWLGEDPSLYTSMLKDSHYFELFALTNEDKIRNAQYKQEVKRRELKSKVTDLSAYLASLEMQIDFTPFLKVDQARIAQLINKSNQFNLTTKRRSEAEVKVVLEDPSSIGITARLKDRFGDYGLIAVLIANIEKTTAYIDTWVMSCRVLERQVEQTTLNELVSLCRARGCRELRGAFLPTAKNALVKELLPKLGFTLLEANAEGAFYSLNLNTFEPFDTKVQRL